MRGRIGRGEWEDRAKGAEETARLAYVCGVEVKIPIVVRGTAVLSETHVVRQLGNIEQIRVVPEGDSVFKRQTIAGKYLLLNSIETSHVIPFFVFSVSPSITLARLGSL